MEPDPRNDGVGHTSFEVDRRVHLPVPPQIGVAGDPNSGTAGTYFYHCHVNTTCTCSSACSGPMLFDPQSGRAARRSSTIPSGTTPAPRRCWSPYAIDPRWHTLDHAAGLGGEDVGLNRFEPTRFYLLGGDLNGFGPGDVKVVGDVLATAPGRKPGLLRFLNATYFPSPSRSWVASRAR